MKKKKFLMQIASSVVLGAVLTSCNIFSSSSKSDYAEIIKSPQISSFEELDLTSYGYEAEARIVGGDSINTFIIEHNQKYGLFNAKTKEKSELIYDAIDAVGGGYQTFYASKTIDLQRHYGVVTSSSATDFSSEYSSEIQINKDIIKTKEVIYRIEGQKIVKITEKQKVDSLAFDITSSNVYRHEDFAFKVESLYSDYLITTYKNYVYQHSARIPSSFSVYYLGEGNFVSQQSRRVYDSTTTPDNIDYDYMELSYSDYRCYKLTTNKYDAVKNKSSDFNIKEPIYSIESTDGYKYIYDSVAGVTMPKRSYALITTHRVVDKWVNQSERNARFYSPDGKIISDMNKGEEMLRSKYDDLSIYTRLGATVVKNKSNDVIYTGNEIYQVMNGSIVLRQYIDGEYVYGAISPNGDKIDMKYQELSVGPSGLFGKRDGHFYKVAYNGVENQILSAIELDTLFYTVEFESYYQLKSCKSDDINMAFVKSLQLSYNYTMNNAQESLLLTLSEPGSKTLHYIANITF